jgi:hypothetical protein
MTLFFEEDMPWLDYLDEDGERDELGHRPIKDDAPEEIKEEYRKYLEFAKTYC